MAVRIRLRAQGSVNRVKYRVVVTDSRSPRDGKYLEAVGWYNPLVKEESQRLFLQPDRIQYWLSQGAQMTDKIESLLRLGAPAILRESQAKKASSALKAAKKRRRKA